MDGQPPPSARFLARVTARASDASREPDLDTGLKAALGAARAAFPELAVTDDALIDRLADCFDRSDGPLATLRAPELRLTCAAGAGDARAIARLEADYFGDALLALRRMGLSSAVMDDALQTFRRRLFVSDGASRP